MIKGLGVDMCGEDRFIKKLQSLDFLSRIFHEKELLYMTNNLFNSKSQSAYLSGVWAAKESFLKALKIGIFALPLNEFILLKDQKGAPFWSFSEKIAISLKNLDIQQAHISLSHESGLVIATTILV